MPSRGDEPPQHPRKYSISDWCCAVNRLEEATRLHECGRCTEVIIALVCLQISVGVSLEVPKKHDKNKYAIAMQFCSC